MIKAVQITDKNDLIVRLGDCVCINGEVNGKKETEEWFAKVTGFKLGKKQKGRVTNEDKVVLATVKNEQLTVLWFHPAKEILAISSMPKANEHPELAMMKRALHKDHYLLGTKHADISMDTIIDIAIDCDISTLCSERISKKVEVWHRWQYTHATPLTIEAYRWCTDECTLNRYWKVDEVMWFCMKCELWYHFDCCHTTPFRRVYQDFEDFVTMPLMKGGPVGLIGTAPLVIAAAQTVEAIKRLSVNSDEWKVRLEQTLGCSVDEFLQEDMKEATRFIGSEVKCLRCIE